MKAAIFSGSIGVNNKLDPSRLPYDKQTGVAAFEEAENIIIDPSGSVSSRRGHALCTAGEFHSVYSPGFDFGYAVQERTSDAALYHVTADASCNLTLSGVRDGLSKGRKVDFYRAGDMDHYSNGAEHGRLKGTTSYPWPTSEWPGPTTEIVSKVTPAGGHIGFLSGIHYFSLDNVLYATEPGLLGLYHPKQAFKKFGSKILMIVPAYSGLYVGTEQRIHFLAGREILKMEAKIVAQYPATEWSRSDRPEHPFNFGLETMFPSFIIGTALGPAICLPDGQLIDLISKNVKLPSCSGAGATLVVDETLIIQNRGV